MLSSPFCTHHAKGVCSHGSILPFSVSPTLLTLPSPEGKSSGIRIGSSFHREDRYSHKEIGVQWCWYQMRSMESQGLRFRKVGAKLRARRLAGTATRPDSHKGESWFSRGKTRALLRWKVAPGWYLFLLLGAHGLVFGRL